MVHRKSKQPPEQTTEQGAVAPPTTSAPADASPDLDEQRGSSVATGLAEAQHGDLPVLVEFLHRFWESHGAAGSQGRVVPAERSLLLDHLLAEPFPRGPSSIAEVLRQAETLLQRETVKTSHPMFLGYVTPPALDIAALGDALAAIVNQNVAFGALSPLGTVLEATAIRWLGQIINYPATCGGILTSGGSDANLYALAAARSRLLGAASATDGNYGEPRRLRIYCSDKTHHSIDKAAILLGMGTRSITRVQTDAKHRIRIDALRAAIKHDYNSGNWLPAAIVGNAGTRLCCAFDDMAALRDVADENEIWFHVDAAYGGFLRLATAPPEGVENIHLADSVVLDPHKLLFVPFDCGSVLVRHSRDLSNCFGTEGEYIEAKSPGGLSDFANLGMQLGRSMKALKVWLALKRFGRDGFGLEITRLLDLAHYLAKKIADDVRFELLGPTSGLALCFRWRGDGRSGDEHLNVLNSRIRRSIIREGTAFIDEVLLEGKTGFRVCMTNFRTTTTALDALIEAIAKLGTTSKTMGEWSRG
ncbi:MAG: hypothetical protein A3G20_10100 [Acidobacteria bacterium RIFCSPLOWO2_12_FULL_59_11]|nr:MAG: hypothetical protein A3G20_10100 [Acidobacteria bacterium RIFCSPLOWO2_12_FULL_59_11]